MNIRRKIVYCGLLAVCLSGAAAGAPIELLDDAGRRVLLDRPAQRIVSLAPHLTELLFAAGAGGQVVGVAEFSDYPEPARAIARVGGAGRLDIETILALRPELVVAWHSGNPAGQVERLQALGIAVFYSEPRRLDEIATTLVRLGRLAGSEGAAQAAAQAYREELARLRAHYRDRPPVSVFYQLWDAPLMTVSDAHLIGDVLRLCGGQNIFAALPALVPQPSREAVLAADPQAIIASGADEQVPAWLDDWRRWPFLQAVRLGNLFHVPPDLLHRPTPRILQGAARVCEHLERARAQR